MARLKSCPFKASARLDKSHCELCESNRSGAEALAVGLALSGG